MRAEKKEIQWVEITSNNTPAPLVELSDGFMEQMVWLTGEVSETRQGVWVMIGEMWRLVGLVERWMERDERASELKEEKDEEKKDLELGTEEEPERRDEDGDKEEVEGKDEEEKENREAEVGEEKGRDGEN